MKTKKYLFILALGCLIASPAAAQNSRRNAQKQRVQQMKEIVKELKLDDNQTALFTELYTNYQTALDSINPKSADRKKDQDSKTELTEEEAADKLAKQLDREEQRVTLKRNFCDQLKQKGFTAVQILKIINHRPAASRNQQFNNMQGGFMPPPPGGGFPGRF